MKKLLVYLIIVLLFAFCSKQKAGNVEKPMEGANMETLDALEKGYEKKTLLGEINNEKN